MSSFPDTALAVWAALLLSLGSIGAIVTVPPARAAAITAIATAELA